MRKIFENVTRLFLVSGVLSLCCVRYQTMPSEKEAARPVGPSSAEIVLAASRIHHPMLKSVAVDLSDGLNPDEAALVAVALNPGLQVERDKAGVAVSQMAAAGLLPDPMLSLGSASPTGRNQKGKVRSHDFGLSLDISSLLNRRFRRQAAAATVRSVNLTLAWREWQVAMAARFQCRKTAILREQAELTRRYAKFCDSLRKDAESMMRQGLMTQAQASLFEAAAGNADREASRLNAVSRQARLEMNRLLGLPPETTLTVSMSRRGPVFSIPSPSRIAESVVSRRPDLLALWSAVKSSDAAYRAEVWNQFPRIEIGFTAGRDTDSVRTHGWTLSGVLPVFDGNRGNISVAKANRNLLLDEYRSRLFQARAATAKMIPELKGAKKQLAVVRQELRQGEKQLRDVKTGVARGFSGQGALLDAAVRVHRLSMSALDLRGQLQGAVSVLETETGLWPESGKKQEVNR